MRELEHDANLADRNLERHGREVAGQLRTKARKVVGSQVVNETGATEELEDPAAHLVVSPVGSVDDVAGVEQPLLTRHEFVDKIVDGQSLAVMSAGYAASLQVGLVVPVAGEGTLGIVGGSEVMEPLLDLFTPSAGRMEPSWEVGGKVLDFSFRTSLGGLVHGRRLLCGFRPRPPGARTSRGALFLVGTGTILWGAGVKLGVRRYDPRTPRPRQVPCFQELNRITPAARMPCRYRPGGFWKTLDTPCFQAYFSF